MQGGGKFWPSISRAMWSRHYTGAGPDWLGQLLRQLLLSLLQPVTQHEEDITRRRERLLLRSGITGTSRLDERKQHRVERVGRVFRAVLLLRIGLDELGPVSGGLAVSLSEDRSIARFVLLHPWGEDLTDRLLRSMAGTLICGVNKLAAELDEEITPTWTMKQFG